MAKLEFKEVRDYVMKSHDSTLNRDFRDCAKSKSYRSIGGFATGPSYYKYFPIDTAKMCLKNGTIALVEPSRWNDAYESLYYEAIYDLVSPDYESHPRVFATCATNMKYDEPAWRIYSKEDNICVQFEIDRPRFRYEILKSLSNGDSAYEGVVQYVSPSMIDNIYKKKKINPKTKVESDNPYYNEFIANNPPFHVDNYLNLLLLKRKDFEHEKETRFFVIRKQDVVDKADKAKEKRREVSDATKREIVVDRGELIILNIRWIHVLKSITINLEESTEQYKELERIVNLMIDNEKLNATEKDEYKAKLKPKPYLVYGTKPPTITIEGV